MEVKKATSTPPVPEILMRIAQCESGNRQFDSNGVLRGKYNRFDVGRFQINELYWKDEAERLNYNLETEEGNTLMALWIFEKYGTKPWSWSSKCWK